MAKTKGLQIIKNERIDLEAIHPSLRHLYSNGTPIRTYKTEAGATVRFFGSMLPETDNEQKRRLQAAVDVEDRIIASFAGRGGQYAT